VRLLVTGGSGVLGRATIPRLAHRGRGRVSRALGAVDDRLRWLVLVGLEVRLPAVPAGRLLAAALDSLEAARADGGGFPAGPRRRRRKADGGGRYKRIPCQDVLCVVEHTFPSATDDHVGFLELR
jgi:NAD(P)-dependent dehydrogenase (short-subunit alcohol dehydrogenase family)